MTFTISLRHSLPKKQGHQKRISYELSLNVNVYLFEFDIVLFMKLYFVE